MNFDGLFKEQHYTSRSPNNLHIYIVKIKDRKIIQRLQTKQRIYAVLEEIKELSGTITVYANKHLYMYYIASHKDKDICFPSNVKEIKIQRRLQWNF